MALEPMMDAALEMPEHVQAGLKAAEDAGSPDGPIEQVLVVGMGGSSIGGALAARLIGREASRPIHVLRDHEPPGFVGEGTLVVATSYSGRTQETLDAVEASLERGARLAAITTGGKLRPLAERAGGVTIEVPSGYQPRAAVGWLLAANYGVLAQALGAGDPSAMDAAAERLARKLPGLAAEGGTADELAGALGDGPVGVVGHDVLGTVARRWAAELSENAKRLAFHAELPEMAHNQLVGWDGQPGGADLVLVRRETEGDLEQARMRYLAERAGQAGARVLEARCGAKGLTGVLQAVLVGDLVSLHLARRLGIDPEPVDVIDGLKERLSEAG